MQAADIVSPKLEQDKAGLADYEFRIEGAAAVPISELKDVVEAMKQLMQLKEEGNK